MFCSTKELCLSAVTLLISRTVWKTLSKLAPESQSQYYFTILVDFIWGWWYLLTLTLTQTCWYQYIYSKTLFIHSFKQDFHIVRTRRQILLLFSHKATCIWPFKSLGSVWVLYGFVITYIESLTLTIKNTGKTVLLWNLITILPVY